MDLSVLSRRISSLEGSLDSLDSWLLAMTLLVIAGVLVECIPEAIKIYKDWEKEPWPRLDLLMLFGGAVVVLALMAELHFESKISDVQAQLRKVNNERYATLNLEAGKARLDAAESNRHTAELLAQIQPRDLTAQQQREIADAIRPFRSQSIGLFNVWEADSIRLSKIFESILTQAGVTLGSRAGGSNGPGKELSEGIEIVMRDPSAFKPASDTRPLAKALYGSLKGKLSVSPPRFAKPDEMVTTDLVIVVGVKPWSKTAPKKP